MTEISRHLLIVCNQPSDNTRRLAEAAASGAAEVAEDLDIRFRQPLDTHADDVLAAAGILIGSTENFGAMAGLIKDFFERIYYPCLEETQGLPCAIYIRAGIDGRGTRDGILRITTGLRWQQIQPPMILQGDWDDQFVADVHELGKLITAGVEAGVF